MPNHDIDTFRPRTLTTRRQFLARSAGTTATLTAASILAPSVHAASDDTLKVALIGCGGRGTGAAAQALNTQGSVVLWAVADLFADQIETSLQSLKSGGQRYDRDDQGFPDRINVPQERRFVGFDAFKKAIDSGVDVAILTTFPHFRPEHYEYAVQAGVNVFQEKPLAVDAPGIRRILAANEIALKKNLKVGVGLQRHHNEVYQETVPRIHEGALGDLMLVRSYWNGASRSVLKPRDGLSEMEFQLRNKYLFTWLAGDHNVEQHIHNIDVCNWIMQGHPIEANGMGGRQYRNGREHGEIFDHHFVEYTYENGTKMYSQCRQIPGCWNSMSEAVHGTKGVADLSQRLSKITANGKEWTSRRRKTNPYQIEHDVLFDAIRRNKPHNETEHSALATMTAILGRMATYSGKVVSWDDAINSDLALVPDRYAFDGTPPVVPNADGVYPCAMPGVTRAL
jgi:myo-inositol 2-dehydrogenase / D-chiro-inositol 1-dehydrogenase